MMYFIPSIASMETSSQFSNKWCFVIIKFDIQQTITLDMNCKIRLNIYLYKQTNKQNKR